MKSVWSIALLIIISCSPKPNNENSEYFFSTASESEKRAKSLLSLEGSEDKSDILKINIDLPNSSKQTNYFANKKFDWIITFEAKDGEFAKQEINSIFDREWRNQNQTPWLYVLPKDSSNWTYMITSEDSGPEISKFAISWKLIETLEDPMRIYSEEDILNLKKAVEEKVAALESFSITYNYTPKEASDLSMKLSRFIPANDYYPVIVLQADKKFDGKEIWDVMMSLGLKWGDMDIFHWNNPYDSYGGDQLMSVWTSTSPGYFFPEEIAAGNIETDDLIFGFSAPRSPAPDQVFEVMLKCATYAKSRLGGKLLDGDLKELNVEMEKKRILDVVNNLNKESIKPGIDDALYLF
ncbi:MAG: cell division protein ZipA C-terminal FtsZ-binding domain-containing protein [bacterium]|nr:cell division protein ZipA C-terminal FtsZ-binding domain-containing protein [bacterium]